MQVASVGPPPINDPLEGFNRVMFEINDVLDRFLLRPIAWTYGFIMPDPAKESVRNVVKNLGAPVVLANNLLQFEFGNAADTMTRFVVNSTAGLAGMFDVASDLGFKERPADFGQTLHVYGVSAGPYLVLPFLGPSTPRHAVGQFADGFFEPLSYALDTEQNLAMTGAKIVIARESFLTELDNLRADSLDYYAALRSLYFQNRQKTLNGGDDGQDRRMDLLFETTK